MKKSKIRKIKNLTKGVLFGTTIATFIYSAILVSSIRSFVNSKQTHYYNPIH
tara:strand:- start:283 stop:438 length:156 start_codon:yes stop_codon:yes gene_type:complete